MSPALEKKLVLATAFAEGMCVLVAEIAGARALAPYYGSSLKVWTAQITATLLFLALGYGAGGKFTKKPGEWKLGATFWVAGLWLALYPFLRNAVLSATAASAGVAAGSFLASALLFGPPLLCLGMVSPLLISRLDRIGAGAGSAAGALFFTNTLGGLAGGWLTALVLIPHCSLRLALAGTGIFLILLGSLWSWLLRPSKGAATALPVAGLVLMLLAPRPSASFTLARMPSLMLMRQESGVGLIQVVDIGRQGRTLLLDGITQGGMSMETGTSIYEFTEYLNFLSHRYHPQAKKALLLGLGTGLLAKQLAARGLEVDVAELEPAMEGVARAWFGLPASVKVHAQDARAYLNATHETYDLIFLDAFAGENAPWYMTTREAMAAVVKALNPGGRLLINSVSRPQGSEGLKRLEAVVAEAFGEGIVYVEEPQHRGESDLINATLLAGKGLKAGSAKFPSVIVERLRPKLEALESHKRPIQAAAAGDKIMTDDFCDVDYAESALRLEWRRLVFEALGPQVLAD